MLKVWFALSLPCLVFNRTLSPCKFVFWLATLSMNGSLPCTEIRDEVHNGSQAQMVESVYMLRMNWYSKLVCIAAEKLGATSWGSYISHMFNEVYNRTCTPVYDLHSNTSNVIHASHSRCDPACFWFSQNIFNMPECRSIGKPVCRRPFSATQTAKLDSCQSLSVVFCHLCILPPVSHNWRLFRNELV